MNKLFSAQETKTEICDKHGEFVNKQWRIATMQGWNGCPSCNEDERKLQEEINAKHLAIEDVSLKITRAGIPERFKDKRLGDYKADNDGQKKAYGFVSEYLKNLDENLKTGKSALFCGKPGTGKTHLAIALGVEVILSNKSDNVRNAPVLFTTVLKALRRVKDTWNKSIDETETQALKVFTKPDLLILDEVGVQFGSDTEKLILFDIINGRYEDRKPTILVSNLMLEDVKKYLGDRIFDRLREDGGEYIPFDWESHRGKA